MAKVWVKGFTRADGVKVKGHYREVYDRMVDPKRQRQVVAKVRLGRDYENSLQQGIAAAKRHGKQSVKARKRQYGSALAKGDYIPSWVRVIGAKI